MNQLNERDNRQRLLQLERWRDVMKVLIPLLLATVLIDAVIVIAYVSRTEAPAVTDPQLSGYLSLILFGLLVRVVALAAIQYRYTTLLRPPA